MTIRQLSEATSTNLLVTVENAGATASYVQKPTPISDIPDNLLDRTILYMHPRWREKHVSLHIQD